MSSLNRDLAGDVLLFRLSEEEATTTDRELLDRNGRNARTLVKEDALRVTMIVLAAGGEIREHQAEGPITVHVLSGGMQFTVAGSVHDLKAGDLLVVGARIRHAVASRDGATFLLTLAAPRREAESA
jgi:quercetin dioxygenase-like cupin family protein